MTLDTSYHHLQETMSNAQQQILKKAQKRDKNMANFIWRWLTQAPRYSKNVQSASSITHSHQMLFT